jgi:squalene cyclase
MTNAQYHAVQAALDGNLTLRQKPMLRALITSYERSETIEEATEYELERRTKNGNW